MTADRPTTTDRRRGRLSRAGRWWLDLPFDPWLVRPTGVGTFFVTFGVVAVWTVVTIPFAVLALPFLVIADVTPERLKRRLRRPASGLSRAAREADR